MQHEVACLAGGCWGASNPRSAAVSHVVGPLIACRASFAWAGARSLQVLAQSEAAKARVTCPSARASPRTSAASTADSVYVPEANRVPWDSGPDFPLCSPLDVLRKVGLVPSGLGKALGSLC